MKICITGATGFLGRHLLAQLAPAHEIVAVSRSGGAAERANLHEGASISEVLCDVRDMETLKNQAFVDCDVVIHAA